MTQAPRSLSLLAALTVLAAAGCKDKDADGRGGSCDTVFPGDLVITEIMADPAGPDTGNEWFEIFNATTGDIGMAGMTLLTSQADGSSAKAHEMDALLLEAGAYKVVGSYINDPELLPAHVHYGYERDLGDLRNAAGKLGVACGDTVIDEVLYEDPTQGASRIYTGERTPDATAADDLNFWCDSTTPFGAEQFGTPGAANDICEGVGSPTECEQDGALRATVPPTAGQVVISEFMPNPSAVGDDSGEWIEITFLADADLNGLELGKVAGEVDETILDIECIPVSAGDSIVLATTRDETLNGGLPRVDALFDFSLGNSAGSLFVGWGGEVLDEVAWTGSADGASTQLDPDFMTPEGNDNEDVFCDGVQVYGAGDMGTPGSANDECMIPAPDGECFEPDGSTRPVVEPALGDILITEFHANPDAVDDADGEWFEVRANASFDLNGLQVRKDDEAEWDTIESSDCIPMSSGDHALIARERDAAVNGGLPEPVAVFGIALNNSDGRLSIGYGDEALDTITWSSSEAGAATQLSPDITDPSANDDEENWCAATSPYGDGDFGSPGSENPACGGVSNGMCDDGGELRAIAAPSEGDLVITEVMANPDAAADADGEWFEVKNTSGGAVDLNGMQMGFDEDDSSAELPGDGECLSVAAGGYAVLVDNPDSASNGGLPETAYAMSGFSLGNTTRTIWIGYGETHWDELTYDDAIAGVAWSVDPEAETTAGNDDPGNICEADAPYGDGDLGSPGGPGPMCDGGMVMPGQCLDGGNPRDIVEPSAGDLVISEWHANPNAVSDANGEWFEVYVDANVDLNGLELSCGGTGNWSLEETLTDNNCISVSAGSYVLFARNTDTLANGGLPAVDVPFGFSLNNSNNGLAVGLEGTFLDEVDYSSSTDGSATQVDPGSLTTVGNDNVANRCAASTAYGDGDNGTPGAANPSC